MPLGMPIPSAGETRYFPTPERVAFEPDPAVELPSGAEVIVVGAGFVGAWAAYHLTRAGMRPLIIEANAPASGASGRLCGLALAGVGGHFARVNALVRASSGRSIAEYTCRSLDLLEAIDAELPGGIEWERCGSLDLLTDERQEAEGRAMAEIQRAEGLPVEMLSTEDVIAKAPALDAAQVRGAKWTPGDGQLNPFKLVYGLLEAAHRMGARSVRGVRVESVVARSGRVWGVETSHGVVQAGAVLLATNAWTPALVPSIAANLTPIREHVMVTERLPRVLRQGFETNHCNEYWRQEPTGELLIGGHAATDEGMGIGTYSTTARSEIAPQLARLLGRFHPSLRDARVVRVWAGLLDFASLEVPMAGALPASDGTPLPGGFLVCGLTGHGLPYSAILALLVSELISSGASRTLPLEPFDPQRYVGVAREPTWLAPFEGGLG
ncbi:MAG: FAD-binding oxidoreductase [Chloroflexi bacterium]|nr:MAG: FAD-binding oxidoreductase [Chloroflexota bacterium]